MGMLSPAFSRLRRPSVGRSSWHLSDLYLVWASCRLRPGTAGVIECSTQVCHVACGSGDDVAYAGRTNCAAMCARIYMPTAPLCYVLLIAQSVRAEGEGVVRGCLADMDRDGRAGRHLWRCLALRVACCTRCLCRARARRPRGVRAFCGARARPRPSDRQYSRQTHACKTPETTHYSLKKNLRWRTLHSSGDSTDH